MKINASEAKGETIPAAGILLQTSYCLFFWTECHEWLEHSGCIQGAHLLKEIQFMCSDTALRCEQKYSK